jgi:glucose uptake protein GlcU
MAGNFAVGLMWCLVAGVGFGTNYLPVKKVNPGDGIFFTFCMSIGIFIVGLVWSFVMHTETTDYFSGLPRFEPYAMLGGVAWMLGNFMCPIIIRWIGLGLGLTVWDLSNMIMGWATGYFGLFGVPKEGVHHQLMNFSGLALAVVSLFFFAQARDDDTGSAESADMAEAADIEHQVPTKKEAVLHTKAGNMESDCASEASTGTSTGISADTSTSTSTGISTDTNTASVDLDATTPLSSRFSWVASRRNRFPIGFAMALLAGMLFGYTFDPVIEVSSSENGSNDQMDYVWSHFAGILFTGNIALVLYVMIRGEKSYLPRSVILPAILSGAIWALAQIAWFKANTELSLVIAFPIVSTLPGLVALLIGVIFFGELRTRRSQLFAGAGVLIRVPGIVLIVLSR